MTRTKRDSNTKYNRRSRIGRVTSTKLFECHFGSCDFCRDVADSFHSCCNSGALLHLWRYMCMDNNYVVNDNSQVIQTLHHHHTTLIYITNTQQDKCLHLNSTMSHYFSRQCEHLVSVYKINVVSVEFVLFL